MLYIAGDEHSPNQPLFKGFDLTCLNATTGQQIWSIFGWSNQMNGDESAIASGYMAFWNAYDSQIYCYGQGPSQTTVTAPDVGLASGQTVVIRGTVMDVSAGTKQLEQASDFPNGVPCSSDASMSQWMEYVYMQKPEPTIFTGVPVTISVTDSNGNHYSIGTVTTDESGMYTLTWTPIIPGNYTVSANFAGNNGYYPSSAETSFNVMPAPTATSAPTSTPVPVADVYFVPAIAGLFVLIIIVAAVLALLMLRKRP